MHLTTKLGNGVIQQRQSLTVLNLSNYAATELFPAKEYCHVQSGTFRRIIFWCQELTEANFDFMKLNDQDILYMCRYLTHKIVKLSLRDINIDDFEMEMLLSRCNKIKELDLRGTGISCDFFSTALTKLLVTLNKLAIPDNFPTQYLNNLGSMPNLQYL